MNRRNAFAISLSSIFSVACNAMGQMDIPSYGVVVQYEAVQGATTKNGIDAVSDTGMRLFGPSGLDAPTKPGMGGGGTSSYAGAGLPRWVRVTWRKPIHGHITTTTGKMVDTLDFGEVIGDYKIEVASRIPRDVQQFASQGKGRAIRLRFRLHDEGVLLAWDVQELPPGDGIWRYSMQGGDFRSVTVRDKKVVEKGWYIHPKTGQRIATDF
jgi:hypothetical protein